MKTEGLIEEVKAQTEKTQTQGWIDAIKSIEVEPIQILPHTTLECELLDIIAHLLQRNYQPVPEGVTEVDLKVTQNNHCIRYIRFVTVGDGADEIVTAACVASQHRRFRTFD